MKHKLKLGLIALALVASITLASAASFYFIFHQTTYFPNEYLWEEPWDIAVTVDYIEAILTITGPAYQNVPHAYILTFENVATDLDNYILMSFDYATKWIVEAEEETLISGSYSGVLLVGDEPIEYTGSLTPTIAGSGDVAMEVSNIVWQQSESITWNTVINNTLPEYVTVESFTIEGNTKTYLEIGTAVATFSGNGYVEFDLILPEVGTLHFDALISEEFRYDFGPLTVGGELTATLTVTHQYN